MGESGYLYLYACEGFFWKVRESARRVCKLIPRETAQNALDFIGLPSNRFIFMDVFYVPIEEHIQKSELLECFNKKNINYKELISNVDFDPLSHFAMSLPNYEEVWGEMEHRYLLSR